MEADRLSGGLAPLIYNLACRQMLVASLCALATLLPEKKLWFSLSWRQGGRWTWSEYCGDQVLLLLLRFEPQFFQCVF
jgi:hypothetical protein